MDKRKKLVVGGAGFIITAVLFWLFLLNAGSWLLVSDPVPERLDVVFTFGGEGVRVKYSRELMERYTGAHWFISDYKFGYTRLLRRDGYDMERVSYTDTCSSTLSEVTVLNFWVRSGEARRQSAGNAAQDSVHFVSRSASSPLHVGLVSSPYHMRRIKMMVNRTDLHDLVKFHYLPVPMERYSYNEQMFRKWWKHKSVMRLVISELQKITYFWLTN
ncbi:MAG: hypothetical protein ACLFVQ_11380 [Chitinispirillaceae bacterium]